jgi:putative aminopeptidase FrvX
MRTHLIVSLTVLAAAPAALPGQGHSAAVASWIAFDAPPGHEAAAAKALGGVLPGWTADGWGNLVRRVGSGAPRRVVACAMDQSAYVVSQVTDDGYLRLRRTGNPRHPLWDQFQEAQRMKVFSANGTHSGVVAVANGHFAQQHRGDTAVVTVDQLWVDVGASSRAEVERMGIALLDPVAGDRPMWTFADFATGPNAGARAGCAAVAAAAAGRVESGETIFVLSTQRIFGWVGLSAALAGFARIDQLAIADEGRAARSTMRTAHTRLPQALRALGDRVTADSVDVYVPAVRWAGSMVESIGDTESEALRRWVAAVAGVHEAPALVALPVDTARVLPARADGLGAVEQQFMRLADLPGVPGHEWRVREEILRAMPAWARSQAVVDSAGNIVLALGPDRDSIAFLAHMDEVAFEVDRILPDGRVTLRRRGGAVLQSWEGVPAYLHFDPVDGAAAAPPLRGVFLPRDSARTKVPQELHAWFGMDSARLVAAGARAGLGLTAWKRAARLAGTRITARGSDDRTGSTALLTALAALDASRLPRKVFFVWTVQEEGGLNGARAFGNRHGRHLRRVYSVDTFVSSDTPLESPHFAFTPLGSGPVLRGLDNGSLPPRAERERILRIARTNGIPLQVGTTQGGTDGSAVSPWGPPNIGLSWPGRYSHGPAEVLDLRDVAALARLVRAVAMDR